MTSTPILFHPCSNPQEENKDELAVNAHQHTRLDLESDFTRNKRFKLVRKKSTNNASKLAPNLAVDWSRVRGLGWISWRWRNILIFLPGRFSGWVRQMPSSSSSVIMKSSMSGCSFAEPHPPTFASRCSSNSSSLGLNRTPGGKTVQSTLTWHDKHKPIIYVFNSSDVSQPNFMSSQQYDSQVSRDDLSRLLMIQLPGMQFEKQ